MEAIYNEEQLCEKCAKWQKILRLQDWDVRTSIVRASGMFTSYSNAEVSINVQHRLATIKMLDPIDFDKTSVNLQDMERCLVHELLHTHIWPFTVELGKAEEDAEEQALNMIANALAGLYRRA